MVNLSEIESGSVMSAEAYSLREVNVYAFHVAPKSYE